MSLHRASDAEIDTIIRVTRVPSDQVDAAALVFKVIKSRARPEEHMSERLQRCRPDQLQIVIMSNSSRRWGAMASSWSAEVEPGQYVRRSGNFSPSGEHDLDGKTVRPDGLVIANLFNCDSDDDRLDQILVLFFQ